jgi:hypothetical protein
VRTAQSDLGVIGAHLMEYFDRCLSWPAIGRRAMEIYKTVVSTRRAGLAVTSY